MLMDARARASMWGYMTLWANIDVLAWAFCLTYKNKYYAYSTLWTLQYKWLITASKLYLKALPLCYFRASKGVQGSAAPLGNIIIVIDLARWEMSMGCNSISKWFKLGLLGKWGYLKCIFLRSTQTTIYTDHCHGPSSPLCHLYGSTSAGVNPANVTGNHSSKLLNTPISWYHLLSRDLKPYIYITLICQSICCHTCCSI